MFGLYGKESFGRFSGEPRTDLSYSFSREKGVVVQGGDGEGRRESVYLRPLRSQFVVRSYNDDVSRSPQGVGGVYC